MKKAFGFQEFDPASYSAGPDWRRMAFRYGIMASVVVVPLLICLMQFLYICYPLITYMMAGVAALYVPALALVRKPSVTITKDFRVLVRNPKTVDTGLLLKAACSALAYFILLIVAVLAVGK
jgi:hypothetical protein